MTIKVSNIVERDGEATTIVTPILNSADQVAQLKKINERNAAFYSRLRKTEEQLSEEVRQFVFNQLKLEVAKGIPLYSRSSFYGVISDLEKASAVARIESARVAGKSKKTDRLQEVILQIVQDSSQITVSKLLAKLTGMQGQGVIEDVDDLSDSNPMISFKGSREEGCSAPISGLKDRLTRARKIIKKRDIAQTR
jgi:hypothetical protein